MGESKYKSVLLIDDSYIDNLINRKILESSQFAEDIVVMDSPYKAIDYLNKCLSEKALPEIIFLDIRMPEMSGFELLQELNHLRGAEGSGVKIYVLSSSLDPNDLKKIQGNNLVTKFIGKPLTSKVLEEIKE
ncbi:response regulator [Pedobacter sp. SYSU D00535]|uniref:response regulator n=1 Tax=Pedobacter sp. SYSU D00535 TaxID=2810308 RepID=UPI001A95ABE3|nr:response regulator [Pedobacter sp. SYSU D00535]